MASAARSVCRHAGCGVLIDRAGYCVKHARQEQQQSDARRGTAHERGYTSAWAKARAAYLRRHPLCVYCSKNGFVRPASVVDHIIAHRLKEAIDGGDQALIEAAQALFWDSANWQSLCAPCHNGTKQSEEKAARTTSHQTR